MNRFMLLLGAALTWFAVAAHAQRTYPVFDSGIVVDSVEYNEVGEIGAGVVIDDAASTRAPSFTPEFRVVSAAVNAGAATAQCDANEFVVTGGALCTVPNASRLRGRLAASQPTANGWTVSCAFGNATAIAVCNSR